MDQVHALQLAVKASSRALRKLVEGMVSQAGLQLVDSEKPGVVYLIVDSPLTWAFFALETLPEKTRAFAVVSTPATHPVYYDCLMSYGPSGAFFHADATAAMAALYAAAAGTGAYAMASTLTRSELHVTRLLLQGYHTDDIASCLGISCSTVHSHVSGILCKTGYRDRAQLVAKLLGYSETEFRSQEPESSMA
jgi:DNA-binding NarL/FixJ family response regulator